MPRSAAENGCGRSWWSRRAALFGVAATGALLAGAALECVHCYSLVHDDLPAMDDDDLRRGRPTAHKAFDEATAILAGDALLTLAFDMLARAEVHPDASVRIALVSELARAAGLGGMVGGQMLDLAAEGRFDDKRALSESDDRHLAGDEDRRADPLCLPRRRDSRPGRRGSARRRSTATARAIGQAFQIADDLLDVEGDAATLGKAAGKDAAAGKATLVDAARHRRRRARGLTRWSREAEPRWRRSARKPILCAPPPASSPSEGLKKEQPMARKIAARPVMPLRLARLHARLLISIAVGMAVTLGLAMSDWSMATKLLLGWDIGVVLYLVLVYQLMMSAAASTRSAAAPPRRTKARSPC